MRVPGSLWVESDVCAGYMGSLVFYFLAQSSLAHFDVPGSNLAHAETPGAQPTLTSQGLKPDYTMMAALLLLMISWELGREHLL